MCVWCVSVHVCVVCECACVCKCACVCVVHLFLHECVYALVSYDWLPNISSHVAWDRG